MSQTVSDASWRFGDAGEVRLSGNWALLLDVQRRHQLVRELGAIELPRSFHWNLDEVDALDSAGARVLWNVWGQRLPENLDCHADYRHWFRRLADVHFPASPNEHPIGDALARTGRGIANFFRAAGGMAVLIGQLMLDIGYCVRHPRLIPLREIGATIYHIGATAMLLLGCVGFLFGAVMAIQIGMALEQFGATIMIVHMMGLAVLRELGPVVCGLTLAGRSGSAITAGIGTMHLTGEYDALRAFGASPSLRLALPQVIGAGISLPLLVVWTDIAALAGGAVASQLDLGIGYGLFLARLPATVLMVNFWIGLTKGALFGLIIALIGCYFGMNASPDTASLSRNTTLSVVTSLTLILLLDAASGALLTNVGLL